ncbi:HMG (high mobility group) box protein [Ceratobasidium sp. AG-Ba]|nr:HMG (high mobility group) box protein [Ceratobasidium sp. AG-Ba]
MADPSHVKDAQLLVNKLVEIASGMRQAANLADQFAQSIAKIFPNDPISVPPPTVTGKKRGRVPKEGKRVKDVNAPKRPPTSYIFFQNDIREELKRQNPGLPYKELLGKVSEAWGQLNEGEKKKYQDRADRSMADYNRAVLDYKGTANGHAQAAAVVPEPTPEADEEEEEEEEERGRLCSSCQKAEGCEEEESEEEESEPTPAPLPVTNNKKPKSNVSTASTGKEKKKTKK